jgi:membrane protein
MASETRTDDEDRTQGAVPEDPTQLTGRSWVGVLKRTVREFLDDDLTDWAAALTYYGILAIFPALLAVVSVLGLIGHPVTQPLIDNLGKVAPGPAEQILKSAIKNLQSSQAGSGVVLVIGLGGALWSSSAYVGAFMRASNAIYDIGEGRPIWKTLTTRLVITIVLLTMLILVGVGVTMTGALASQVGKVLGVGSTAVTVWDIAKWPVIILAVITMFAILYWAAPNVKQPGFLWATPGTVVGLILWIIASAAFALYVGNFSSYNKTYGALGGVIIFLVWLWISNIAILLGAELNAEIERGRQIQAGAAEDKEPFLEPRDARKLKD